MSLSSSDLSSSDISLVKSSLTLFIIEKGKLMLDALCIVYGVFTA